jgi:hypothetical protein
MSDEKKEWIPNPEYAELLYYPVTGAIGSCLIFDQTKPRLSEEEFQEQKRFLIERGYNVS